MSLRTVTQQIRDEFYLVGAWLGDGCSNRQENSRGEEVCYPNLTSVDEAWSKGVASILGSPVRVRVRPDPYKDVWTISLGKQGVGLLESHGYTLPTTAKEKYISFQSYRWPDECLWELLAGLMDTDGSIDKPRTSASVSYWTSSKKLSTGFASLCEHLGLTTKTYYQESKDHYCVAIRRGSWVHLSKVPLRLGYKKERRDALLAWHQALPNRRVRK